ncbi:hypothetical protein IFT66_05980 [Rhizobium sp. CFBP 13726]|uniref:hypothetical protein n=1 Tax=Rhizobium sp. CFBP 13726 TaxID=2775296 RepID=UPI0017802B89|nr:hypothetical protein [Rhizobium sp. CFBP 13726]MBD8650623.1 hypothetical protein [Rhizobium sp. CFBP 13726]
MRIGIVCEGPTDFYAIKYFAKTALSRRGVEADFFDLQPQMDATQAPAGWTYIENWLRRMDPVARSKRYFGGGLFEDDLDKSRCDLIIVQMDCDHLTADSFVNFVSHTYSLAQSSAMSNYNFSELVLGSWCGLSQLTSADSQKYVLCPAEQSTESWCVAAFKREDIDPDTLSGSALVNKFMSTLHRSEGRAPTVVYAEIDKSIRRREKFCKRHAESCFPHVEISTSFRMMIDKVASAAQLV